MDTQLDHTVRDVKQLHGCIDDLMSLLALAAAWSDGEPSEIARTTLDMLIVMLALDFVYVRLSGPDGAPAFEMVRLAQPLQWQSGPREIGAALDRSLGDDVSKWPASAQMRIADVDLCVAPARLGLHGDIGIIVAGSRRSDFPGKTDRLLLGVAANQAAIALQEVHRSDEQKQVARALDEPANQRTRERAAANEELKKEITGHRQAEGSPRDREHNSRLIGDGIPGLVAIFTPSGEVELVTRRLLEYFGRTLEDLERWGTSDDVHPEDVPRVIGLFTKSIASGDPFEFEVRARRFDGIYRWFQSRGFPLRDANGRIVRWLNLLIDIDERKRAEEALLQSQSRLAAAERDLRLMIDSIPVFIAVYEPDGMRSFVNRIWQDYMGITAEEATGAAAKIFPHFHPADKELNEKAWRASLGSGEPLSIEVRVRRADGQYRWHTSRRVPLRDETEKIVRWYSIGIDIDDQKVAEDALRRSETRLAEAERELRLTLESIPVITWRGAANGYVQQLNKRWFEYTGTTPEQVRGRRWKSCVHPEDLEQLVETGRKYVACGTPIDTEARLRRFDGTYRWFLFRPAPARDETGKIVGWYGTITDIEDRKRAEDELRRSEAYLAEAQRLAHTGSWAIDYANRKPVHSSEEHHRLFGFDPAGGMPPWRDWMQRIHPEDRSMTKQILERSSREKTGFEMDYRVCHLDGTIKYLHVVGHPVLNTVGDVVEFVGTSIDVTERRQAEQSRHDARNALAHANRLSTMGQLTASIAHEVNQPIAATVANAQAALLLLGSPTPDLEEVRQALDCIVKDAKRAGEVTGRIRALIQKAPPRKDSVDINEAVREVIELTRGEVVKNGVLVHTQLAEGLPLIQGDRVQLQQVVLNLIINAVQAMGAVAGGARALHITTSQAESLEVLVAVKDSGPGLVADSHERIFDPFYSTKPGGLGMGLSICRSIIEGHNGRLWVTPNLPHGAIFQFTVPARSDTSS
jgi:PAS domain S-box-containing protein